MSDAYLRSILAKYQPHAFAASYAGQLGAQLLGAPLDLRNVKLSGSWAKGTAVSVGDAGSDVDLFLSFAPGADTLRNLYEDVYAFADRQGWAPRRQRVSIGLRVSGYKIDLVPARVHEGDVQYHSLYVRQENSWRQTNVQLHVDQVSQSGRTEEMRVLKIWRTLHGLDVPSFYLELALLEALKWRRHGDLANNVSFALEFLRDSFEGLRIVDPANSNNVISDSLSAAQKRVIAQAAGRSRQEPYYSGVVW